MAYSVLLRRIAGPSEILRSNGWPLLAAMPMAAVILLTGSQPFLVSLAAGSVAYVVAVAGAGGGTGVRCGDRRRPARALAALVEPAR